MLSVNYSIHTGRSGGAVAFLHSADRMQEGAMEKNGEPFKRLSAALSGLQPGPVDGSDRHRILAALADAWPHLPGSGEGKMTADKLDRAEQMSWEPSVLSFRIERHGGTVAGSVYAELVDWKVDTKAWVAVAAEGPRRLVRARQKALDIEPMVIAILDAIDEGASSPLVHREASVVIVKLAGMFKGDVKKTRESRNQRLKKAMFELARERGWAASQSRMIFRLERQSDGA